MNNTPKRVDLHRGIALLLCVAAFGFASTLQAKERILQLAEDTAVTRPLRDSLSTPLRAAPVDRVCEAGAKWIRLGFSQLELGPYDALTIKSSGGDSYTFEGGRWNDRAFSSRALRGDCVEIQTYFVDPNSRYQVDRYEYGTKALAATSVVVAGAGDICDSSGSACSGTSDLIVSINPTAVFTAGDNAYESGTLSEYNARYAPTWGRFKVLTSPSPGNHDYNTVNANGYFDYFNGVGNQTGPAGDRSKGYYSWDVGDWHFISLNTMSGGTVASAQLTWLNADLAANTKPCTAAYWHHPLVSRGNYSGYSQVKPFWDALYAAKADLVLVGHDHNYQRYGKMNPSQAAASDGIRQVLVGTGGRAFYALSGTHPMLERSNANTYGVLKLTLTTTGYTGNFVPVSGGTFTDTFSGTCNKATPVNVAPVANFSFTTSALTATFTDSSTDSDGTIASRSWNFGDASTSTATSPSHTYSTAGTYNVTLTVTDNGGLTNSISKSVTVNAVNVAPVANFNFTTSDLIANFTDSSTDSDGTIASRSWNFGDSATSTTTNPSHTYAAAGTYSVTLMVTDNGGATNSVTKSVSVSSANAPPVANFSSATSGLTATFTDASSDSNGTITSRAWNFGDSTTSTLTNPSHTYAAAGTYSVALTVTDNGGLTNTKTQSVTVSTSSCGGTVLCNGVAVTGISAALGGTVNYTMVVPAGATGLKFVIAGGTGDADLYVKFGSAPTTSVYDCRPYLSGNNETCNIATAQAGIYYVMLRGYAAFSGVSLTGSYSTSSGPSFTNNTVMAINDNTTIVSSITVSGVTGAAPATLKVPVNITHTYQGDLKVDLIAPNGTTFNLWNRTGGGTDNINQTFTVNASSVAAPNGVWKLQVADQAAGDTGTLNSWGLQF